MRTSFRSLAAGAALSLLILSMAVATALAAGPATVERYDFDDEWCFDSGIYYDCSIVDATLLVTITPDGRALARIHFREQVQRFDPSGVQIGSLRTVSFDRTVFADGGQDETFSVSHTRSAYDGQTCVSTYLFKIVDYELKMDRYTGPGCS